MNLAKRDEFDERVNEEVNSAEFKHGYAKWGRHEFYGILLEEVDELWETIKKNEPRDRLEAELIQVAAVCLRYFESGER